MPCRADADASISTSRSCAGWGGSTGWVEACLPASADLLQEAVDGSTPAFTRSAPGRPRGPLDRTSKVQRNAVRSFGGAQGLAQRLQVVRQLREHPGKRLVRSGS